MVLQDYDVERDKYGRIVTGSNKQTGNPGRDRERSRERDRGDRGDWDRRNVDTPPNVGSNVMGMGMGKYGNTYGLSSQFLESLGIDGPLIPRIFVSNVRTFSVYKARGSLPSVGEDYRWRFLTFSWTSVLMIKNSKKFSGWLAVFCPSK